MEPDIAGDRDEMVAEALGIDIDTLEELGDYEIETLIDRDGLCYGFEIEFAKVIPAGIRRHLNEPRSDRSAIIGPNSFDYDDRFWQDDIPWADPQIQLDYEAALGRFLVRFNRVENAVDNLITMALEKLNRTDVEISGQFLQRVERLELVMLAFPSWPSVPKDQIKSLAGSRNELAHGHFDQNPYQGDYEIVSRKKSRPWSPSQIESLGDKADEIWHALRNIEACFYFEEIPQKF